MVFLLMTCCRKTVMTVPRHYHISEPVWRNLRAIPDRLEALKGERSGRQWARDLDIPQPTLQMYLDPRRKLLPPLEFFIHLHRRENVNLNWLLAGDGEMYRD